MIVACCVCRLDLDTEEAHTFHEEECHLVWDEDGDPDSCLDYGRCGDDCHPGCCPACNALSTPNI